MADFLKILVCVLAVFGGYTVLRMIKESLLYPRAIREHLRGAVLLEGDADICAVARYASHLKHEQKISSGRLIILVKDDIIGCSAELFDFADVYCYRCTNSNECKERDDDT